MTELNNQSSTCECSHLINSLKGREIFDAVCRTGTMKEVRVRMKVEKAGKFEETLKGVGSKIDKLVTRRLNYLRRTVLGHGW